MLPPQTTMIQTHLKRQSNAPPNGVPRMETGLIRLWTAGPLSAAELEDQANLSPTPQRKKQSITGESSKATMKGHWCPRKSLSSPMERLTSHSEKKSSVGSSGLWETLIITWACHQDKTEEDEKKRGQSRPARNEPRRHRAELKLPRKSTGSRKTGLGWKVGVPSYWSTFALPGISLSPAKKDAIFKSWVRIKGCQKILLTPSRLCFINWDYCSIFSFIACQLLTRVGQSEVGSQELFELSFRSTPAC